MNNTSTLKKQIVTCILASQALPTFLLFFLTEGHEMFLILTLELLLPFVVFICVLSGKKPAFGLFRIISAMVLWGIFISTVGLFMTGGIVASEFSVWSSDSFLYYLATEYYLGILLFKLSYVIGIASTVFLSYKLAISIYAHEDE